MRKRTKIEQRDVLVLGGGRGGRLLAQQFARLGRMTSIVDRRWVGDYCTAMDVLDRRNSADVFSLGRRDTDQLARYGMHHQKLAAVRDRKRLMVEDFVSTKSSDVDARSIERVIGFGRFIAPKILEVFCANGGVRTIEAQEIFLNLGSSSTQLNIPGIDIVRPLTALVADRGDHIPSHLVIVGSSYQTLELSQAFSRRGSRVTIVEKRSRLLPDEDAAVSSEVDRILRNEGVDIRYNSEVVAVQGRPGEFVGLDVRTPFKDLRIEGSDIVAAVGAVPNTLGVGLNSAGVETTTENYIRVNESLQTSAPGVWAIGTCAGSGDQSSLLDFQTVLSAFTQSLHDGTDVLEPRYVFTDPLIGRVGLTEAEAVARHGALRIAKIPQDHAMQDRGGDARMSFMKALVCPKTDRILSFTIMGPQTREVLEAMKNAMRQKQPYVALAGMAFAHPAISEGLALLFDSLSPPIVSALNV